jgi:hypothetical protein
MDALQARGWLGAPRFWLRRAGSLARKTAMEKTSHRSQEVAARHRAGKS